MEYVSLKGERSLHTSDRRAATRWVYMPYGKWTCADGREVLFNRFYEPLWQRTVDGTITRADPNEWVTWEQEGWFYNDGTPDKHATAVEVLDKWGLPRPRYMRSRRETGCVA